MIFIPLFWSRSSFASLHATSRGPTPNETGIETPIEITSNTDNRNTVKSHSVKS